MPLSLCKIYRRLFKRSSSSSSTTEHSHQSSGWYRNLTRMNRSKQSNVSNKDRVFWDALLAHQQLSGNSGQKKSSMMENQNTTEENQQLAALYGVDSVEIDKVRQLFVGMDKNGSGSLTAFEIAEGLVMLGHEVSPKTVQAVMRVSDKDRNGTIDFDEFLIIVMSKAKLIKEKNKMDELLVSLAKDSEEFISANELVMAWEKLDSKLTLQEAKAIIDHVDPNGDGKVSIADFLMTWRKI